MTITCTIVQHIGLRYQQYRKQNHLKIKCGIVDFSGELAYKIVNIVDEYFIIVYI